MSSKSDRDNRSNQLNPNNDAYYSSRSSSSRDFDDDDENYIPARTYRHEDPPPPQPPVVCGFGAVNMSRTAVYVTVSLLPPRFHRTLSTQNYLEDLTPIVQRHLEKMCGMDQLALFTVFDPSDNRLPWHVPLDVNNIDATRNRISLKTCEFVAREIEKDHPGIDLSYPSSMILALTGKEPVPAPKVALLPAEPYIQALRAVINSAPPCIATIQVPIGGRISLEERSSLTKRLSETIDD